jgi:hypothetical protein
VLAAALGRGYTGRHRLAEAALGRDLHPRTSEVLVAPAPATPVAGGPPSPASGESTASSAAGRSSIAPWLRVVPAPPQPDQLADTLPHPVVTLFPLVPSTPSAEAAEPVSASATGAAEERVFAIVDAERELDATVDLAAGVDVRPYRARHTA